MKNMKCGICLGAAVVAIAVMSTMTLGVMDSNPAGTTLAGGVYYDFNPWIN